jgi:alanine-synthesizing transaminase
MSNMSQTRNESSEPFVVQVADRVKRLPPYLFAKLNALKYQKRREGRDIIDLGMGNPTDVPDPLIIEKLCEAAHDDRNHRYSVSAGLYNLRREVARRYERKHGVRLDPETEVIACLGSKEAFSHMCLALIGPGDTAIVPAPSFPIHVYAVYLASGNVISLDCTQPESFLSRVAMMAEHLYPRPKLLVLNFPHNPTGTVVERDFFVEW